MRVGRLLLCVLVLVAGCAIAPVERGWHDRRVSTISGSQLITPVPDNLYSDPTPVQASLSMLMMPLRGSDRVTPCDRALRRGKRKVSDFIERNELYSDYVEQRFSDLKVELVEEPLVALIFSLEITDVPVSLASRAPTAYCMVDFEVELIGRGTQSLLAKPGITLNTYVELYSHKHKFFVSLTNLRSVVHGILDEQIEHLAPVLKGEAKL